MLSTGVGLTAPAVVGGRGGGGGWTPASITTIKSWWGSEYADTNPVGTVSDQGPAEADWGQITTTWKPALVSDVYNGLPTIRSDGVTRFMYTEDYANVLNYASPVTLAFSLKYSSGIGTLFTHGTDSSSDYLHCLVFNSGRFYLRLRVGNVTKLDYQYNSTAVFTGDVQDVVFKFNGVNIKLYVDGTLIVNQNASASFSVANGFTDWILFAQGIAQGVSNALVDINEVFIANEDVDNTVIADYYSRWK